MFPAGSPPGLWDSFSGFNVPAVEPPAEQTLPEYINKLAQLVRNRVHLLLLHNEPLINSNQYAYNDAPLQPVADAPLIVNQDQFKRFAVFPDLALDLPLLSKLALATPSHPDLFSFPHSSAEQNNDQRSARIATQWLRECFGDESLPKPSLLKPEHDASKDQSLAAEATSEKEPSALLNKQTTTPLQGEESILLPHDQEEEPREQGSVAAPESTAKNHSSKPEQLASGDPETKSSSSPGDAAAAAAPASAATSGGSAFHCNGCKKALKLRTFRIRCAECDDFDLCETCFCDGVECQGHLKTHYYIPVGPNQFPLYDPNWTADEELALLDAVGKFGFGNWHDVAEYVSSVTASNALIKDKEACERRYFDFHLNQEQSNNPFYPFSSLLQQPPYAQWKQLYKTIKELKSEPSDQDSHNNPADHQFDRTSKNDSLATNPFSSTGAIRPAGFDPDLPVDAKRLRLRGSLIIDPPQLPPKTHVLGFLPYRGDFENEYENLAELSIADLDIREDESPMEKETKLRMLEYYNCVLDERLKRKKLIIERRLFDKKWLDQLDRQRSAEERSLNDLVRPLWKHTISAYAESPQPLYAPDHKLRTVSPAVSDQELEEFIHLVLEDRQLISRLNLLTAWKQKGLSIVKDILENGGDSITLQSAKLDSIVSNPNNLQHGADVDEEMAISEILGESSADLEKSYCQATGIRKEFLLVLKEMLCKQVQSAVQSGQFELDAATHEKVYVLKDGDGGVIPINDFAISARVEMGTKSSSMTGGSGTERSTIPKKKKTAAAVAAAVSAAPPSSSGATASNVDRGPSPMTLADTGGGLYESPMMVSSITSSPVDVVPIASPMSESNVAFESNAFESGGFVYGRRESAEEPGETEEGEIEEDEEDMSIFLQHRRPPPPPAPSFGAYGSGVSSKRRGVELCTKNSDENGGLAAPHAPPSRGGKGEKRQRRGSGGLGLATFAAAEESGIAERKSGGSLVSSNVEWGGEELLGEEEEEVGGEGGGESPVGGEELQSSEE